MAKTACSEDKRKALDYGARLLSFRNRSVKELEGRLKRSGFSEAATEEAIQKLSQLGYLDDVAFARLWISDRFRLRNMGKKRVKFELLEKGVDRKLVEAELSKYSDEDEKERALILAKKKCLRDRDPDPVKRCRRLYKFLATKGFDPSLCGEISRTVSGFDDDNRD